MDIRLTTTKPSWVRQMLRKYLLYIIIGAGIVAILAFLLSVNPVALLISVVIFAPLLLLLVLYALL